MRDSSIPVSTATAPPSPLSLEAARKVMWLRTNHRPLGELLDEGYLNQSRLERAAAKAYDPKLKQAAVVLLDEIKRSTTASSSHDVRPAAMNPSAAPLSIGMARCFEMSCGA